MFIWWHICNCWLMLLLLLLLVFTEKLTHTHTHKHRCNNLHPQHRLASIWLNRHIVVVVSFCVRYECAHGQFLWASCQARLQQYCCTYVQHASPPMNHSMKTRTYELLTVWRREEYLPYCVCVCSFRILGFFPLQVWFL